MEEGACVQRRDGMRCTTPSPGPIRSMRLIATITDRYEQSMGRRQILCRHLSPSSFSSSVVAGCYDLRLLPPCPHLAYYRSNTHGLANHFRSLQHCLRVCPLGRLEIHRDPHEIPRRGSCFASSAAGSGTRLRLYACLTYATVCCLAHAPSHAEECWLGHEIAVDVDQVELFCCACGDQVYDSEFDKAVVLA